MEDDLKLRYPIGKQADQPFADEPFSERIKQAHFLEIRMLPELLENSILNLDAAQLNTPYRPGGWTVQQVVHHVPDSHMNAYMRFKLALTEDNPTIKPYDEGAWAQLPDTEHVPINVSLTLLHALHRRWYDLMEHIPEAAWEKTFVHPERNRTMTLWQLLGSYAWHGKHHVAHITTLRERMGW